MDSLQDSQAGFQDGKWKYLEEKMVCCDGRNARDFFELDKGIRKIIGLGRRKWMGEKKIKITFPLNSEMLIQIYIYLYIYFRTIILSKCFFHLCFGGIWEGSKWWPDTFLGRYLIYIVWLLFRTWYRSSWYMLLFLLCEERKKKILFPFSLQ